jgi:hypothetical protein
MSVIWSPDADRRGMFLFHLIAVGSRDRADSLWDPGTTPFSCCRQQ